MSGSRACPSVVGVSCCIGRPGCDAERLKRAVVGAKVGLSTEHAFLGVLAALSFRRVAVRMRIWHGGRVIAARYGIGRGRSSLRISLSGSTSDIDCGRHRMDRLRHKRDVSARAKAKRASTHRNKVDPTLKDLPRYTESRTPAWLERGMIRVSLFMLQP